MKPSFSIGAKNGLLEQKHLEALGPAVWLYLWFLDKQPKDTDRVLGGQPITYQMFAVSFPDVPRRTYGNWLERIKAGGYVELLRTPKGYGVTINKPKKWNNSDVPKSEHHKAKTIQSDVPNLASDVPKSEHPMAKNGTSNIKETVKQTITNNRPLAIKSPELEEISKIYYEVIKAYSLPVTNHNTLRLKIKAMSKEAEHKIIISYLKFLLTKYQSIELDFKPQINSALDIYSKRIQIENAIRQQIKKSQKGRAVSV